MNYSSDSLVPWDFLFSSCHLERFGNKSCLFTLLVSLIYFNYCLYHCLFCDRYLILDKCDTDNECCFLVIITDE